MLQTANKGGNDRGHFRSANSGESQSPRTVPQMQFLAHESADTDRVDWMLPSDRQLSGFPQLFCLLLKDGMKINWIFVGRISHLSSINDGCVYANVCARLFKTASCLHGFNQRDRGLQTWCWECENPQHHLACMILVMTNIIVYTSLVLWRLLDLREQCQFSQGQRQQQKTLLESSGKLKVKK